MIGAHPTKVPSRACRLILESAAAAFVKPAGSKVTERLASTCSQVVGDASEFWAAVRAYLVANRGRIVTTRTLLQALDGATSVDLGRTLFDDRFPRLY